jgi:hypothetical protein
MESTTRNRKKRQRLDGTTIEYPDIPHVPIFVIPCFVEAIRVSTKFFQLCKTPYNSTTTTTTMTLEQDESSQQATLNVHANLMNRVQDASDAAVTAQQQEHSKWLERRNQAVETWIQAVKRFAPRSSYSKPSPNLNSSQPSSQPSPQPSSQPPPEKPSVPHACFLYLWDLQQQHSRIAVRRAALSLGALLLQKSKDCRFHLEQGSILADWISSLTPKNSQGGGWILLQHEASLLLDSLETKGYARLYPKIGVAAQRLRQQCPDYYSSSSIFSQTNKNIVDWRRIRDLALQHGSKEIQRLEKLLAKSHACLEILVPRMGQEHTATSAATTTPTPTRATNSQEEKMEKHHDDDGEEESDIDWEDGDKELEQDERELMATSHVQHQHHHAHHLLAVDRTLAAMESAGGLRGGELEIDMTTTAMTTTTSPVAAQQDSRTLEKLRKLVHLLVDRHLPRLSLWLDGLTNADNLVLKSSALVLLPPASTERRQQLVEKLSELKRSVSSILSSAAKLDKETTESSLDGVHSTQSSAPQERTLAPRLGSTDSNNNNNSERASLLGSISRQQKRRRQEARSNRIRIKCKSR